MLKETNVKILPHKNQLLLYFSYVSKQNNVTSSTQITFISKAATLVTFMYVEIMERSINHKEKEQKYTTCTIDFSRLSDNLLYINLKKNLNLLRTGNPVL